MVWTDLALQGEEYFLRFRKVLGRCLLVAFASAEKPHTSLSHMTFFEQMGIMVMLCQK